MSYPSPLVIELIVDLTKYSKKQFIPNHLTTTSTHPMIPYQNPLRLLPF